MNKKYYIFVGNEKIEVDQKIYQNYWQITNRENYLERLDRKSKLLFFSDLSSEYPCEESLADETVNVEKIVETKMMLQAVREAISELNDEEREIIFRLFYEEESLRSIAKDKEISAPALLKRRNKIFEKLKKLLKDIIQGIREQAEEFLSALFLTGFCMWLFWISKGKVCGTSFIEGASYGLKNFENNSAFG